MGKCGLTFKTVWLRLQFFVTIWGLQWSLVRNKACCWLSHTHGISYYQDTEQCLEPQPQLMLQTQRVEMVQRWVAHWICNKLRQGLTEMISHIGSFSVEAACLTLLYRMAHNFVMMSTISLLISARRSTRAMPHMPMFPTLKPLYQYYNFLLRTVTDWNDLPNGIAAASSLEAFKASVMKHLAWIMLTYF